MGISLFIFDWSGVISDDRRPVYEANMKLLRRYKKPTMSFEEWLPRTTLTPIEFLENQGVRANGDEIFELYKKFLDGLNEQGIVPTIYPNAKDTLKFLHERNKSLAVLSSHPSENVRKEAENYEVEKYFILILGDSKDKTEGIRDVIQRLAANMESTLYLGDTVYDIRAAKAAGVLSAGISTGYHTKERLAEESPDFLLDALSDLKDDKFL